MEDDDCYYKPYDIVFIGCICNIDWRLFFRGYCCSPAYTVCPPIDCCWLTSTKPLACLFAYPPSIFTKALPCPLSIYVT